MGRHLPFADLTKVATITRADRVAIGQIIDKLIALLDATDGDPDLEEDDWPGGDPLDDGEIDESRPRGIVLLRPRYGKNQSRGPLNERETRLDYQRRAQVAH